MTREIKFRAWDVRGKRMIYYGSFEFLQLNYPISVRPDSCEQLIRPLEGFESSDPILEDDALIAWNLMQFTGLKDKNGKEIFEGDVVTVEHCHSDHKGKKIPIVFFEGAFCLDTPGVFGRKPTALITYFDQCATNEVPAIIEVIGSIHENPELLPNP